MAKMRKTYIPLLTLLFLAGPLLLSGEDYQYQYFQEKDKGKYVPFSDYIPRVRLHYKIVPHYVEDFYELYGKKLYYNENSLMKNIERLKTALNCKFRHPSEALVRVESEAEYLKYRNLMFMHINMLIMRNHLRIAARYDKHRLYFYNLDFAKEIRESLDTAEKYYKEARPYWENAKRYARRASDVKITTDLGTIESERYAIMKGETDFDKIIDTHLKRLDKKKKTLDRALAGGKR